MTSELLDLATRVAREAAYAAADLRAEGVEVTALKSTPTDVVTRADRQTETRIREALAATRPRDGFFGEESDRTRSESGLTWVVDPIDGTVNYLYGLPAYAVSVAVVEGDPDPETWRTLAGCVVNPVLDETYAAALGEGATCNGRPLRLAPKNELAEALVATGFAYAAETRARQAEVVARLIPRIRDIRRYGAASLDLCLVAAGRLDAYYETGLNPWDHAAGALVARESGAVVGGPGEGRESVELLVAANPGLEPALRAALREAGLRWA